MGTEATKFFRSIVSDELVFFDSLIGPVLTNGLAGLVNGNNP